MKLRRIRTLYMRDLIAAIRDGRILIAVLLPIALAVYYSVAIPDPEARPSARLVVVGDSAVRDSQFMAQIRTAAKPTVKLTVTGTTSASDAKHQVRDHDKRIGLKLPPDIDQQIADRKHPDVQLLVSTSPTSGASILAGVVSQAAMSASGDAPPVTVTSTEVAAKDAAPVDRLGINLALGIFAIMMLAGFIAFLVVPVLLMEEVSLRTLEALQLVATTWEIIAAKVAVGMTYCAIAIAFTIPAARLDLHNTALFVVVALVISLTLTGFGLAFGLALGDAARVNTWSGVILLPMLVPVFISLGTRQPWTPISDFTPTGAGSILLAHAAEPSSVSAGWVPAIVVAAWLVGGGLLLRWLLERRSV